MEFISYRKEEIQTDSQLVDELIQPGYYNHQSVKSLGDLLKENFRDVLYDVRHYGCAIPLDEDSPTGGLKPNLKEKSGQGGFKVLDTELVFPIGYAPKPNRIYAIEFMKDMYTILAHNIYYNKREGKKIQLNTLQNYHYGLRFQLYDKSEGSYPTFYRLALIVPFNKEGSPNYKMAYDYYNKEKGIILDSTRQCRELLKPFGELINDTFDGLINLPFVFAKLDETKDVSNLSKVFEIAKCSQKNKIT